MSKMKIRLHESSGSVGAKFYDSCIKEGGY